MPKWCEWAKPSRDDAPAREPQKRAEFPSPEALEAGRWLWWGFGWSELLHTVDGRNPCNASPKNPWNDDSAANTNKQCFPIHSISFPPIGLVGGLVVEGAFPIYPRDSGVEIPNHQSKPPITVRVT